MRDAAAIGADEDDADDDDLDQVDFSNRQFVTLVVAKETREIDEALSKLKWLLAVVSGPTPGALRD